jgi:acyl-coenzyme A synthetase/AMP-(fatty) acid ligase
MSGEDHEGGNVLGVFADREQAKGAFVEAARNIPFAIDGAREDEDGSIHLHGGCDWLSLSQEVVQGTAQLEGGAL